MNKNSLFTSNILHDICIARLNGELPIFNIDNLFTPINTKEIPKRVDIELTENGILISEENQIDYPNLFKYLKAKGINVEKSCIDFCG